MKALFFRTRNRRFRLTQMPTGVVGNAWVLDLAGRHSEHSTGGPTAWRCRTDFPATTETMALLLQEAVNWSDSKW